jgi:hypothetical protein
MGDEIKEDQNIFRPKHYVDWKIDPITFLMLNNVPFAEGNIIKYIMRWKKKNGIQDLRKAIRYIEMLIELEENKEKYIPRKTCL